MFDISGKKTLITGGTAGIGKAVAKHFVEQGAEVIIAGRRDEGAQIAKEIGARFIKADVSDHEQTKSCLNKAVDMIGKLDVLILNAGVTNEEAFVSDLSFEEMRKLFAVNFDAVYAGIHYGSKLMNEGASIIITSSPAGVTTTAGFSAYSSSKAACNMLARTTAIELAPLKIRVNTILPGGVHTDMMQPGTFDHDIVTTLLVTGKLREPEENVGLYHFLASEASAPMTGSNLVADDGLTAGFSLGVIGKILGE